jgi:hypothetical protein
LAKTWKQQAQTTTEEEEEEEKETKNSPNESSPVTVGSGKA